MKQGGLLWRIWINPDSLQIWAGPQWIGLHMDSWKADYPRARSNEGECGQGNQILHQRKSHSWQTGWWRGLLSRMLGIWRIYVVYSTGHQPSPSVRIVVLELLTSLLHGSIQSQLVTTLWCTKMDFAKHPWFCYFALNTEIMRWCSLQAGRIYVWHTQHTQDAHLIVQEPRDMIGYEGAAFSNWVLHFASSLEVQGLTGLNSVAD